jgi:hypothetical protein
MAAAKKPTPKATGKATSASGTRASAKKAVTRGEAMGGQNKATSASNTRESYKRAERAAGSRAFGKSNAAFDAVYNASLANKLSTPSSKSKPKKK